MDESRKQFSEVYEQMKHDRFGSNEDWAWKFWQASREAIEIELPMPKYTWRSGDYSQGFDKGLAEQRKNDTDAIRAAGIKVKE